MELLLLLIERKGQLVTRDQIIERIWGKDVFVDTDNSINAAIRKIRQVLKDDPEQPRFVQTITGRGYRFIAAGSMKLATPPVETRRRWNLQLYATTYPKSRLRTSASALPIFQRSGRVLSGGRKRSLLHGTPATSGRAPGDCHGAGWDRQNSLRRAGRKFPIERFRRAFILFRCPHSAIRVDRAVHRSDSRDPGGRSPGDPRNTQGNLRDRCARRCCWCWTISST